MKLTDATLRALQPPQRGQKAYYDEALPAFGLRISQGGTRSFFLQYGQDRRLITIGRYPIISLSQARTEAKRLLAEFTLGKVRPQSITYSGAVELFLEEKGKGRRARTVYDYKRLLNRFNFKGQLSDLTHQELERRIKRFTSEGEYNHLLVALKVFCNWAIKRRYIEHNPTVGLSTHATQPRSRVLSDAELQLIWRACEAGESPVQQQSEEPRLPRHFCTIVKLLILTGQRKGEITALRSDYISNNLCTLPATLAKNGREHTFPIGKMAASTLARVSADGGLLFPARGTSTKPFNGWSKSKAALDKLSGVSGYTLHDIRRTVATRMAELGVAPHVIERILNHVTGSMSAISRVYNQAAYLEEMRQAFTLWEAKLASLSIR